MVKNEDSRKKEVLQQQGAASKDQILQKKTIKQKAATKRFAQESNDASGEIPL